eukprot:TRINITY_DN35649_c0_g1_i3.p1 TRINITY_DN35649_c0_g1~~TRINITY_DN35649_c0_g1_i3.p1  ORF type:complete len:188 (-),score=36.69 TRINITY_DN35649_c0_g1_i3:30-593(-)
MAVPGASAVHPVFLLNKHLPAVEVKDFTVPGLCVAAERCSGYESMEGAQRIGGLWRLYPLSNEGRNKLLTGGILLRGLLVQPSDTNPFALRNGSGAEFALRNGSGAECALRNGSGAEFALRNGSGAECALRNGSGAECALRNGSGVKREMSAMKLFISNIPLSVPNADITQTLEQKMNMECRSHMMD